MTRAYYTQEQFNYGKLGVLLRSRYDAQFYKAGCKVIKNYRPSIQGPAIKRRGTRYLAEVKDSSVFTRLIRFSFNQTDSYTLEFGNQYIRFFQDDATVFLDAQDITNITQANPAVLTYSGSDTYANGDEVEINSVVGMTEVNGKRFRVANVNVGANTFELTDIDGNNINSTGYTAYSSGGNVKEVYEIASPYSTSDLPNIKYDQEGDVMYIAAGGSSIRPQKLVRTSSTNWSIGNLDNIQGPVEDVNESTTTITLSGTLTKGGTSTWTASAAIFNSAHVGSVWAIAKSNDTAIIGYARMTGFTSTTVATFTNQTDLTPVTVTATTNWYEASWSGVRGYPRAVAFHESRLFWAGTDAGITDVYGSVSNGVYENYDTDDATPDDGLRFKISGQTNKLEWLVSDGEFLVAGSLGGLSFIEFNITDTVITPRARSGSTYGSSSIQGIKVADQVCYLHSNNKTLYEAAYNDVALNYNSLNLNDINPDILTDGASYIEPVEQPGNGALLVCGGELKCISRDKIQQVTGWYEFAVNGSIESLSVLPSAGDDTIYVIVNRTIDGATRRYVEVFENSGNKFLDSHIIYSGAATRTFTGLEHLEGELVSVYGDDSYAGDYTVSGGSITIPDSKTEIEEAVIGHLYNADLECMPIDVAFAQTGGTTQALMSRVNYVYVVLYQTIGLQVGTSFDSLDTAAFRNVNSQMTSPPALFADVYPEVKEIPFSQNWTRTPTICFRSPLPFASTICAFTARMEINSN